MAVADDVVTAQIVGKAFVDQYYSILHLQPQLVPRFYQVSSVLSRPEEDGSMSMVYTVDGINQKILSLDYSSLTVEILSVDAQPSYKDGVMLVVTGILIGDDDLKRKFTQSFFLAPQNKGYFVLNDVFRYLDDDYKSVDESASNTPDPEPTHVPESIPPVMDSTDASDANKQVNEPLETGELSATEKVVVKESSEQESHPTTEKTASNNTDQEDTPKRSFASIVNALKDNAAPFHRRTSQAKPIEQPRVLSTPPAPSSNVPSSEKNNNDNAGKAYAIFVANLPMNATVELLEREFKKFGPIKPEGIQVRSNKQKGSCFGFVEFESASSMHSALEASPIVLYNRRISIKERRANNNNDRVRYHSSGRGGYRNNNLRGYARNDVEKRGGGFSGRPRGNAGRNGEAVPMPYHQNGGRVALQEVKVQ